MCDEKGAVRVKMPCDNSDALLRMDRLIGAVDQLHSAPSVAMRVLELLRNPDFDPHGVRQCLESDPAIVAAILRLVNSSSFGLVRKVSSLGGAITYLGVRTLRLAILSFGLVDRLTRGAPAQVCRDFWQRALTMAAAAAQLHSRRGARADEAYTAGLLSDIGVLLLAQADTDTYTSLYARHEHGSPLLQAERQTYGFDHPMLAARLLGRWNLAGELAAAVALHHVPEPDSDPLRQAVTAGDLLADVLWTPGAPRLPHARQWLATQFGLDLDGFITLAVGCRTDISEKAKLFRADLNITIDCDALRAAALAQYRSEALQSALDLDSLSAVIEGDFGAPFEPSPVG